MVNTATGGVVATVPVGGSASAVALNPTGSRAYVTLKSASKVAVIDTVTNKVLASVAVGLSPTSVVLSPNGSRAYVTNSGGGTMSVIDTATNTRIANISVGLSPAGITMSRDGTRIYMALKGSDQIAVVDAARNTVITRIKVGNSPRDVALAPTGGRLYVANGAGSVSVIDTVTNRVAGAAITVGPTPTSLIVSPDGGQVFVANGNDTVSVIDTATSAVVQTFSIDAIPESGNHDIAVSADGTRLYVTDSRDAALRVVSVTPGNNAPTLTAGPTVAEPSLADGAVSGSFTVGDVDGDALTYRISAEPSQGTVTVTTVAGTNSTTYSYLYTPTLTARQQAAQTSGPDSDSLTITVSDGKASVNVPVTVPILPAAATGVTPVAVGSHPVEAVVSGNRLYIHNTGDSTVSVIDTTTNTVINTIPGVGSYVPMVASPDGRYLYVGQYDSYYVTASVKVIDTSTRTAVATITMPKCETECWANSAGITDMAISPDGKQVYVSEMWVGDSFYAGTVTLVDATTNTVVAAAGNSQYGDYYSAIEVSPDGTRLYAASGYPWIPGVDVMDARTLAPLGFVRLDNPDGYTKPIATIAFSPDGRRAYTRVTHDWIDYSSQTFAVIDTTPGSLDYNTRIATIMVPVGAQYLMVSADGTRAYVVHEGGKTVTVIDTATNMVIGSIASSQLGGDYAAMAVGPNGTVYFTNYANNAVYAVAPGEMARLQS
ncbi:DUF5074 domain-containing protein [Mycolicibacterium psychrotolerans]|nr:beta-propeller fold lactonase family protein [Mycolicibacterium psychrotolerans]